MSDTFFKSILPFFCFQFSYETSKFIVSVYLFISSLFEFVYIQIRGLNLNQKPHSNLFSRLSLYCVFDKMFICLCIIYSTIYTVKCTVCTHSDHQLHLNCRKQLKAIELISHWTIRCLFVQAKSSVNFFFQKIFIQSAFFIWCEILWLNWINCHFSSFVILKYRITDFNVKL